MDFPPPCAQPDILTLCTLFHLKSLNRFCSRAGWVIVCLCPLMRSGKFEVFPLCCLAAPACFQWPHWEVSTEHQLYYRKLSLSSQGFRNSWGRQCGAAEGMGLCRPSWGDGDTCQLSKIQIPTAKLMYVECCAFFSLIYFFLVFFLKYQISLHSHVCSFTRFVSHLSHDLPLLA